MILLRFIHFNYLHVALDGASVLACQLHYCDIISYIYECFLDKIQQIVVELTMHVAIYGQTERKCLISTVWHPMMDVCDNP